MQKASMLRRNRGRLILVGVLAVSLLGNAVSLGAVLQFQRMRHSLLGPDAQAALFPRDYRRDFSAALKAHQPEIRQDLAQIVAARSKVVEMAQARPFDRVQHRGGDGRVPRQDRRHSRPYSGDPAGHDGKTRPAGGLIA